MFKKGQRIVTVDHVEYQHLKDGAVVDPPIEHEVSGGRCGVVNEILVVDDDKYSYEILFDDGSHEEVSPNWVKGV